MKAARQKQLVTYKGNTMRLLADFSAESLQARREWQNIFKVLKKWNLQSRKCYLAKLSCRIKREIKGIPNKQKFKEFITTQSGLKEMLVFYKQKKNGHNHK